MNGIFAFLTGRRTSWLALAGCLVAVALTIGLLPGIASAIGGTDVASAGDSGHVAALLTHFPAPNTDYALVVWTRRDGEPLTPADRRSVAQRAAALGRLSIASSATRPERSANRTALLAEVQVDAAAAQRDAAAVVAKVRSTASSSLAGTLRARFTGTVVTHVADQRSQSSARLWILLFAGLIVAALVLLVTRRLLVWIVQLVVVGAAAWLTFVVGDAICAAIGIPLSVPAGTVLVSTALIMSAGFCLAFVRRADAAGRWADTTAATPTAARAALRDSLPASVTSVTAAAVVLALGMLALAFAAHPDVRAIAVSVAVGVILSALLVLIAVPALLTVLAPTFTRPPAGPRDARRAPRPRRPLPAGIALGAILGLAAVLLIAIEVGATAANPGTPGGADAAAQRVIDEAFGTGAGNQAIMIVPRSLGGETSTVAPTTLAMTFPVVHSVTRDGTRDGNTELIVALDADPGSAQARATIERLRASIARTGGPTARTLVGGPDAAAIDIQNSARTDLLTVLPLAAAILIAVLIAAVLEDRRYRRGD